MLKFEFSPKKVSPKRVRPSRPATARFFSILGLNLVLTHGLFSMKADGVHHRESLTGAAVYPVDHQMYFSTPAIGKLDRWSTYIYTGIYIYFFEKNLNAFQPSEHPPQVKWKSV